MFKYCTIHNFICLIVIIYQYFSITCLIESHLRNLLILSGMRILDLKTSRLHSIGMVFLI